MIHPAPDTTVNTVNSRAPCRQPAYTDSCCPVFQRGNKNRGGFIAGWTQEKLDLNTGSGAPNDCIM